MIFCIGDCHIGLFSETSHGHIPGVYWDDSWEYVHTAKQSFESTKFEKQYVISVNGNYTLIRLDAPTAMFSFYNKNLEEIMSQLKSRIVVGDSVLFSFGEIDCNDNIVKKCITDDMKLNIDKVDALIELSLLNYRNTIEKYLNEGFEIIIYGPPAGAVFDDGFDGGMVGDSRHWNFITSKFTDGLIKMCEDLKIKFITLFVDMVSSDGRSISKYLHHNNSHVNPVECFNIIDKQIKGEMEVNINDCYRIQNVLIGDIKHG